MFISWCFSAEKKVQNLKGIVVLLNISAVFGPKQVFLNVTLDNREKNVRIKLQEGTENRIFPKCVL